jgi:very-short-patch-repair endonuclease
VTVPRGDRRSRQGIRLHWANLPDDEITTHQGIPTTTVPRTLLDLSAIVHYPRKPGILIVKAVVEEAQRGLTIEKSDLEELFQAFLINAGLPLPQTNVLVEGIEVDCVWPAARLIVELDSRTHHDTADAVEADRARDRRLEAAGWPVVRITWRQLQDTRADVERDLRRLITAAPAPASPG